ncbi:MAG TPA: efflux RND transporter periplasmic adaptor subunit [Thermoanaerobaculia bacterium]|nr:efflux RND transporter periplasmic adaptor subunit [Thermoanaerobaculia bacterium]
MRAVAGTALAALVAASALSCREAGSASAADQPRIELKASVAPFQGVTVKTAIDGTVAQVAIPEGYNVRTGDLLFTLSNPGVDRDLAYAKAAVAAADFRLRTLHTPAVSHSTDAEKASAEIVKAREQKVARLRGLLATGDIAKQELQDAEVELAAARRDWLNERERLATPAATTEPAVLQAEADRARADLVLAQHRKALLTINAPASGTLSQVRVHPGDEVYLRDPLAEIVDVSTVRVQAPIAPELMRYVHAGQTVEVKLMTIPARRFREPIARVNAPGPDSGPSIVINVPNPDRMLQAGTPAVVTVQ